MLAVAFVAALVLIAIGVVRAFLANRALQQTLNRLNERQASVFDSARIESSIGRITRDVAEIGPLLERAQLALATISRALRIIAIAVNIVARVALK